MSIQKFLFLLQHILYNHLPWFAKEYGSLTIWSTQGMEKSHYQARGAFFRHTRHGGGRVRANNLKEVFQWFYRRKILQHKMKKAALEPEDATIKDKRDNKDLLKLKRKNRWKNSIASAKLAEWRSNKVRISRKWLPGPPMSTTRVESFQLH